VIVADTEIAENFRPDRATRENRSGSLSDTVGSTASWARNASPIASVRHRQVIDVEGRVEALGKNGLDGSRPAPGQENFGAGHGNIRIVSCRMRAVGRRNGTRQHVESASDPNRIGSDRKRFAPTLKTRVSEPADSQHPDPCRKEARREAGLPG
jgi:hypothetical protein